MKIYRDQLGNKLELSKKPSKVVSLVPSITEYLIDLGVQVIGRTKFCVHPDSDVRKILSVGGTKKFNAKAILNLEPDVVIANKEENTKEDVRTLQDHLPVWVSDVPDIASAMNMMTAIGELFDKRDVSVELLSQLAHRFESIRNTRSGRALYLIWKNPWMAVGTGTYIDSMLRHVGYENVVTTDRYPVLTHVELQELKPEVVLLSSEPYPFKDSHVGEINDLVPDTQVQRVNGEFYSWYGTRLIRLV